jgi:hypothetical protein
MSREAAGMAIEDSAGQPYYCHHHLLLFLLLPISGSLTSSSRACTVEGAAESGEDRLCPARNR